MPLSATLATDAVFQVFQGPSKLDALLHGHSYAGNPIGCAVACEALSIFQVGILRLQLMQSSFATILAFSRR